MTPLAGTVTSIYHAQCVITTIPPMWRTAIQDWTDWLVAAGRPATTISTRTYHIRRLAGSHADLSPWSLTRDDLITWTGRQDWSVETRRSYRSSLVVFYRWAHRAGRAPNNPADDLPNVRPAKPRPRPCPDDVYSAALDAATPRVQLVLRLAAEMGMRRAEIAVVHHRDLIHEAGGYSLLVHGKGRKDRIVPMTPGLAAAVRHCVGYLFPGDDEGHLSPRYIGTLATRVLPGKWTIHSLRHRFANRIYAVDHDLFTVQDLLGHASPNTTRAYVLPPDEARRRLVLAAA